MKEYQMPIIKELLITIEDIICTSGEGDMGLFDDLFPGLWDDVY